MTGRSPLLEARSLTVLVPGRELVRDLSLSLQAGSITALLGPNGSGKTLCLQSLAGLRHSPRDCVLMDGAPLADLPRRSVAQRVGYLPQDPGSDVVGTVFDYVALGLYPRVGPGFRHAPQDEARLQQALRRVQLDTLSQNEVGSLSGGERRRLDLALLQVQGAALWLLDEPTNHLDPAQEAELLRLLRAHRATGGAALVSLHDPSLAADIADFALLLHGDGRWQFGVATELLTADKLSALYQTTITLAPRLAAAAC